MKRHLYFLLACAMLILSGCTTVLNRYKPFSDYVGKEVALARPCILEEYVTTNGGTQLYTYWEGDQPTELVYADRMFTRPARIIVNDYKQEQKLYPASDYPKRIFFLRESVLCTGVNRKNYGGPHRIIDLPAGYNITIDKGVYVQWHRRHFARSCRAYCASRWQRNGEVRLYVPRRSQLARHDERLYQPSALGGDPAPAEVYVGWNGKEYGKKP
jgi:uncharacterized protein YceK